MRWCCGSWSGLVGLSYSRSLVGVLAFEETLYVLQRACLTLAFVREGTLEAIAPGVVSPGQGRRSLRLDRFMAKADVSEMGLSILTTCSRYEGKVV